MSFVEAGWKKDVFTCPHCGVMSGFFWVDLLEQVYAVSGPTHVTSGVAYAKCASSACRGRVIWFNERGVSSMLWPVGIGSAPSPHEAMPPEAALDYNEARAIAGHSPRGAAALLRLAVQKLCLMLGEPGRNINDDIGSLVKKGMPVEIQQALDVVRVVGNNAVHPGEIRIEDDPGVATALFGLVNAIVDNRIAQPARIKALFNALPTGAKEAIQKRDAK